MTPACAGSPLNFHADDPAVQEACKAVCRGCELRESCYVGAVQRDEPCGVWGAELFGVVEMAEPVAHVRVQVYAPVHNRAHYVAGCRHPKCLAANTAYMAIWRATHVPVEPKPDVAPQLTFAFEPLSRVGIGSKL